MDILRLRELLEDIFAREERFQLQNRFVALQNSLSVLANNPQQPSFQTSMAAALDEFRRANEGLNFNFDPSAFSSLVEINADRYFLHDYASEIAASIQNNPITPAAALAFLQSEMNDRANYLGTIGRLRDSLVEVGVSFPRAEEGEAEVGFRIPRLLFQNDLDGLLKELSAIRFIVRSLDEAATGTSSPIVIRDISTSDPIFFFSLPVQTIALIGGVITWALKSWKSVEEIRKVRAETKALGIVSEKKIKEVFGSAIDDQIKKAIDEQINVIKKQMPEEHYRAEMDKHLNNALESLLARIERGMTVEIRFLAPQNTDNETAERAAAFKEIASAIPRLIFPGPHADPILKLPGSSISSSPAEHDLGDLD